MILILLTTALVLILTIQSMTPFVPHSPISDSEEAELLKEFEKIQKEREAERQRLEEDRRAAEIQSTADGIMRGNPLLHSTGGEDYTLKKKWYDDVVFKHQSRSEPVKKQRFINDTTRNDFHRKFLSKYVK